MRNIPKAAFFDMDETIVATRFYKDGIPRIGFPIPEWMEFAKEKDEHTYDDCTPIWPTVQLAKELQANGCKIHVLTVVYSDPEKRGKTAFFERHRLTNLFGHIIFTDAIEKKVPIMLDYAKQNNLRPDEIMIVEDHFPTCVASITAGFQAAHLANILMGNIP